MTYPAILYKYMDERGVDMIWHRRVRASNPLALNDPFELYPGVPQDPKRPPDEPFPRGYKWVRGLPTQKIDALDFFDYFLGPKTPCKIICLSSRNDGILLWAHYAAAHKGFAVGLSTDLLGEVNPASGLHEVKYGEDRPSLYDGSTADVLGTVLGTKSIEWSYEKEWRISLVDTDAEPMIPVFRNIKQACVREVILGARCPKSLETKIVNALEQPGYSHVRLFRARLDDKRYQIIVEST